ncbi:zinc finger and BTB domain-containing protein 1 [Latimeria chalumnae]|uniref:Zinc finger and BTB domain containing 1 n=1 Tax=Latimeria chalumnae TaxID=7897 RepID=H3B9N5_LATCH|nr:PREDICTED: zinc finger and BTB domain-containing protein 1 [Latimeria chalumnae]XP_005986448.1 PREDICTED: zinc finger and BTB domain-containing protein 1 [Latimeria chalumnae]XP_005986449.1 PREDICTED: zinc finger and BTB domain-containing protein 1 [Latimeria chalumnae]XP_005986450.1 PREDICTED: zinc finger and BTB domain-containing protein 1 [Latimeria chalumnae]|eukprot:XP_005986447.1 PREDICTED: zinc finger and BTB domain-containing protein 1 [Latimeria chalumnae]
MTSRFKMPRPSHSDYVLQQLSNQREWGFLCDCCIAIDDIYFQAHKAVLAACSSYFKMLFINHQSVTTQLDLSNMQIRAEYFDLILQLMYLGKIIASPTDFQELKSAMTYLQLYYIPECLEDIQDSDCAVIKHSSFSSHNHKMMFGVRMYEDKRATAEEEISGSFQDSSLEINFLHSRKSEGQTLQFNKFREQPYDLCKKTAGTKLGMKDRALRRFGKSYMCDNCGFVFSCERLLDEHHLTCTNRHPYQNLKPNSSGKNRFNEMEVSTAISSQYQKDRFKLDMDSHVDEPDISCKGNDEKNAVIKKERTNDCNKPIEKSAVVVKVEPEDNSAADLHDIKIVKITDDSEDSNEEYESEQDLHALQFNMEDICENKKLVTVNFSSDTNENSTDPLNVSDQMERGEGLVSNVPCELCGIEVSHEDLSSHYITNHLGSICACGKCGQILVKGRQLLEHAQTCGEPQDLTVHSFKNTQLKKDLKGNVEEPSIQEGMTGDEVAVGGLAKDAGGDRFKEKGLLKEYVYKHAVCPFRCPHCGQRFETEKLVVEHMSECKEEEILSNAATEEPERDHRRRHFCNICGKGFYQRCHLREHYTVHTKEKQFVCQICGKQFLRERQLRLHNDMHKGMARYICPMCDQGNFRKHDHVRHMISHLSAGETICQICFQIFPNNEQLEQHMDVHLYICGVCGAKFSLRKDMRSHYNAKHLKRT